MKALARYQLILLGKQRHIGVNNLPKVVARQCRGRELKVRLHRTIYQYHYATANSYHLVVMN